MSVLAFYFGWPDGAVWSNLLASLICAVLVWWRLRARMIAQHAEHLAQAARHHREHLEQSETHHAAIMRQADSLHEGLKSHVSAVGSHMASAVAVPQQLLDDIKKAPGKPSPMQAPRGVVRALNDPPQEPSAVVAQKMAGIKPGGEQS